MKGTGTMRLYSLWDRKLKEYGQLVQANNSEAVSRALTDGLRGSNSLVEKHPDDFDLMDIGTFDPDSGQLTQDKPPVFVCNVSTLLQAPQPEGE